jgi:hypothetical protein
MPTKVDLVNSLLTSYRAKLAVDGKKDLLNLIAQVQEDVKDKVRFGVALSVEQAAAIIDDANACITSYNTKVTLPFIDKDQFIADFNAATNPE